MYQVALANALLHEAVCCCLYTCNCGFGLYQCKEVIGRNVSLRLRLFVVVYKLVILALT